MKETNLNNFNPNYLFDYLISPIKADSEIGINLICNTHFLKTVFIYTIKTFSFRSNLYFLNYFKFPIKIYKIKKELWSIKEMAIFETGICIFGKRFELISHFVRFTSWITKTLPMSSDFLIFGRLHLIINFGK